MEPTRRDDIEDVETDPAAVVDDAEAITAAADEATAGDDIVGPYTTEDLLALLEDAETTVLGSGPDGGGDDPDPPAVEVETVPNLLDVLERAAAAADEPAEPNVEDETVASLVDGVDVEGP